MPSRDATGPQAPAGVDALRRRPDDPGDSGAIDEVVERILDATLEAATVHGVRRTSMSDVARRAGMSRPTLYKRFSSKDELVRAVVARETSRITAAILEAATGTDDPTEALDAAVLVALREVREHPLLDRVIRTEPETLVPMIVADPSPVMVVGREAAQSIIARRAPRLSDLDVRRLADVLIRLLVSYALTPPDDPPEVVASSVAGLLASRFADADEVPHHATHPGEEP